MIQYCPVKNSRFFTSFRMTDYYILFVRDVAVSKVFLERK